MRCREARIRVDRNTEHDNELREHLDSCRACRDYEAAADRLKSIIEITKAEPAPPVSEFHRIRAEIENEIVIYGKGISFMSRIKQQVSSHPGFGFSLLAVAGLLLIMILVPFSYNQTVGYSVAFEGVDPELVPTEELYSQVLTSLGIEQASVQIIHNNNDVDCKIGNLPDKKSAREAAAAFNALSGYDVSPIITPVVMRTSASLYAQARDKMNKIEVDGKGKTDAEIKAEIESKLRDQGFVNPRVSVDTRADGMREIAVGITDSSQTKVANRQMEINISGDDISFSAGHEISIDAEGKTDEQIKSEIESKMKEQGLDNPKVTITKESDGRRKIEVEVEKEDDR